VSILSERRAIAPYGMSGGDCGSKGLNLLLRPLESEEEQAATAVISSQNIDNETNGSVSKKRRVTSGSDRSESAGPIGAGGSYRTVNIGSKSTVAVNPGDRLVIMSPGGGGYGESSSSSSTTTSTGARTAASTNATVRISGSLQDYTSMQESV